MTEPAGKAPHHLGHRQRLRRRFLEGGPEAMPDYELLELLLCLAIPQKDVKPLAKDLIARFGGLASVLAAGPQALMAVPGIKENAAAALALVKEAAQRLARQEVLGAPVLSSWDRLLDYCRLAQGRAAQEEVRLLFLDGRSALIADEILARGSIDHAPLYPREVVRRALEVNARALILVHNHPSGEPTPSEADIAATRRVGMALEAVGIALFDHLVIGRAGHASFRTLGLL